MKHFKTSLLSCDLARCMHFLTKCQCFIFLLLCSCLYVCILSYLILNYVLCCILVAATGFLLLTTGPPAHSVGCQISDAVWRLSSSSSVVVCNTLWRASIVSSR